MHSTNTHTTQFVVFIICIAHIVCFHKCATFDVVIHAFDATMQFMHTLFDLFVCHCDFHVMFVSSFVVDVINVRHDTLNVNDKKQKLFYIFIIFIIDIYMKIDYINCINNETRNEHHMKNASKHVAFICDETYDKIDNNNVNFIDCDNVIIRDTIDELNDAINEYIDMLNDAFECDDMRDMITIKKHILTII